MPTPTNSYEVTLIKKIPYLTELLLFLLLPGLLVLFTAYFFLVPSGQSANEMQIVTIIRIIPEKGQFILLYLGLSTIIFYPLYKYLKIYKRAFFTFNEQILSIQGKNFELKIPVDIVSKIYFKDPDNYSGESKETLTIYIQEKFMKTTTLRLRHYLLADQLITELSNIEKLRPRLAESDGASYIDSED